MGLLNPVSLLHLRLKNEHKGCDCVFVVKREKKLNFYSLNLENGENPQQKTSCSEGGVHLQRHFCLSVSCGRRSGWCYVYRVHVRDLFELVTWSSEDPVTTDGLWSSWAVFFTSVRFLWSSFLSDLLHAKKPTSFHHIWKKNCIQIFVSCIATVSSQVAERADHQIVHLISHSTKSHTLQNRPVKCNTFKSDTFRKEFKFSSMF